MASAPRPVTHLLARLGSDQAAADELLRRVYDELREMAERQLRRERAGHTLDATALVHEAYVKLIGQERVAWNNRAHFFGVAALAMRRVLINYAQRRLADKRGGGAPLVTFEDDVVARASRAEEIVALDEALDRLARYNERQARVVTYRFFGGLKQDEIAELLGISVPTVQRDWRLARAWLSRALTTDGPGAS
ncbi:MAG: sigma-70 family RNA polymerase sigma factor [Bacteroidota bacterium]